MTRSVSEITPRILRDMRDGVLALDMHGRILYLNEQGRALLGESQDLTGQRYTEAFLGREDAAANDAFHQLILDAVYDKDRTHSGEASYRTSGGEASYRTSGGEDRRFRLTTSFLRSEDGREKVGIVAIFSDVTEIAHLNQQRRESSIIFAVLMICVCLYLFF